MTKFETLRQLIVDIQLLLIDASEWDKTFVKFEDKRQNYLKIDTYIAEATQLIADLETEIEAASTDQLNVHQINQLTDIHQVSLKPSTFDQTLLLIEQYRNVLQQLPNTANVTEI